MAAKSPGRSIAGPEVLLNPTPISPAMIGGPVQQHVIKRLAAPLACVARYLQVASNVLLAYVLVKSARTKRANQELVVITLRGHRLR